MRSLLAFILVVALSACGSRDSSWERAFALKDAIDPVWDVAIAAQWYELENGRWPTSIDQIADLDDALGHVTREPPEPVPVPAATAFNAVRFEIASDSLLRVHFDLTPFESSSRGEMEIQDEDGSSRMYSPPATTTSRSRGIIEVPAYREGKVSALETQVWLAEAMVQTAVGKKYEFKNERRDLQSVIFLKPRGNAVPG